MGHLQRPGQNLPYDEENGLLEEKLGSPAEDGLVRLAHFQPRRTHQAGISVDGKVLDWISVWSHKSVA